MEITNASYLMKEYSCSQFMALLFDVRSRKKEKYVNKFFVSEEFYHKPYQYYKLVLLLLALS
jgi:hypothetical protein